MKFSNLSSVLAGVGEMKDNRKVFDGMPESDSASSNFFFPSSNGDRSSIISPGGRSDTTKSRIKKMVGLRVERNAT